MILLYRKRVRPISPKHLNAIRLFNHFKEPERQLVEQNYSDSVSVTEESRFIMPRTSPRNDLFRLLQNKGYSDILKMEHIRGIQQVRRFLFLWTRPQTTRFLSNIGLSNSISLTKISGRKNLPLLLLWKYFVQEKMHSNQRVELVYTLLTSRYLEKRVPLHRSLAWLKDILLNIPDRIFEYHTRMTWRSFGRLLELLETRTPQFFKRVRGRRQLPISIQLHLALFTFGFYGNGASFESARVKFGYGIGTIYNARRRVVDAITSLASEYITWPGEAERRDLCKDIKERYGYRSAFFMVDGTTHNFAFVPSYQRSSWFDRKSRYSMQALVTNDIHLRVRHLVVGWPGSTHDSRILSSADYMRETDDGTYFTGEQHGLGDAAFGVRRRVVPNYKDPLASIPENREYNLRHSSLRVKSEHTIGHVKNRFQGLKEVRLRLANKEDVLNMVKYITAGYVLHNILLEFRDEWHAPYNTLDRQENEVDHTEGDTSEGSEQGYETSDTGFDFREKVKHQVLQFIGYE